MRRLSQAGNAASAATTAGSASAVTSAASKASVGMVSNHGHPARTPVGNPRDPHRPFPDLAIPSANLAGRNSDAECGHFARSPCVDDYQRSVNPD